MHHPLYHTIRRRWPPSIQHVERLSAIMRPDNVYLEYSDDADPSGLYKRTTEWLRRVEAAPSDDATARIIDHELREAMLHAVYGSNRIERAGLSLALTSDLCRAVSLGEPPLGGVIPEQEADRHRDLVARYRQDPEHRDQTGRSVLRGRNEVVQHAKAFLYLVNAFVSEELDMTEDLIKETHRILTLGVPIADGDEIEVLPEKYGGKYRTVPVSAGTTNFSVPKFVPAHMSKMCKSLKEDLAAAAGDTGTSDGFDPISLAAKYSQEFVNIHPFQDGNGRMCRLILNAILCRYVGVVVPIGETRQDRDRYIEIARNSNKMEGHGEYALFVLGKVEHGLRKLKKKVRGRSQG